MPPIPQPEAFIRWFRLTAPYLHAFGGRTFVVAFGGEMITDRARFTHFIQDINLLAALDIRLVLVHGARPQIEAELKAKGLRSRYAKGLRVTDAAALVAVKDAAGALRVEIEALLSQGLPNSPMAGADIRVASGNFIIAKPIGVVNGVDLQYSGSVRKVDTVAINRRLEGGEVVLIPHIGYSPTGEVFNLAWEDAAVSVAVALKADKLLLFSDWLPTDRKGEVIAEMTAQQAETLAAQAGLPASSARTLGCAMRALAAGVGRAHLLSRRVVGAMLLELFTRSGVGTMITADPMEKIRTARIDDVRGIIALIEPLEAEGTLVKRSRELLEREIGNFTVILHDGVIAGCAALYPFPKEKSAEFACLAVGAEYRDAGYGEQLLLACEERARAAKIRKLFALTTRAAHWFLEQGFKPVDVKALPEQKQALYNWKRNSKVFLKPLR